MRFDPNDLYYQMVEYYHDHKNDGDKVIFCNEGSSRSSKTWDFIHFVVTYCDHNRGKNKDIYFLRDSLVNCRDFTLKEVEKCFNVIGIPFNPIYYPKPYLRLWGNNIYFRGLDDEKNQEGFPSHISFVNEALDVNHAQIKGILMRCEEVFAMDWNPKVSDHWAFSFEKRPNCLFTHSTYKNNKHLPLSVVREIESYDPGNPVNVEQGTADDWRHKVYALGLRASPEGVIFPDVTWISEFPNEVDLISWGMDFGHTHSPTVITKGGKTGNSLYFKKMFYKPEDNTKLLSEILHDMIGDAAIYCDGAEPGMIADLRMYGIMAIGARGFHGSVNFGIAFINSHKIYLVSDPDVRREQENYKWKTVGGISTSEPEKKGYEHFWDSARYLSVSSFRNE